MANPFVSEWNYSFPFYSSELLIYQDGTFKFHDQGCIGHRYSEGIWMTIGNKTISLQSLEKYDKNKELKFENVISDESQIVPAEKGKYSLNKIAFTRTYKPNISDTMNIYFNNLRLVLSSDTLYCPDPGGLIDGSKFSKNKNYL